MEEEIEGDFTAVADEFIQDPEDSSRRYCGMQDAQNSAIKLLASRLIILPNFVCSVSFNPWMKMIEFYTMIWVHGVMAE